MWPRYLPSLFFKFLVALALANFAFAQVTTSSSNKETPKIKGLMTTPGVIESFEKLIDLHKGEFKLYQNQVRGQINFIEDFNSIEELRIDPVFLKSILFHSKHQYTSLINNDECYFASLIENDLLKVASGPVTNVVVTYKTKNGLVKSAVVSKNDYLKFIYRNSCPQNAEARKLFNLTNVKSSIGTLNLAPPKSRDVCRARFKKLRSNKYLPYICKIPEVNDYTKIYKQFKDVQSFTNLPIQRFFQSIEAEGAFYNKNFSFFERTYLKNFCEHLNNQDEFCKIYIKEDYWQDVVNGEKPDTNLQKKCQAFNGVNNKLTLKRLGDCITAMKENPDICELKGADGFPALVPMPDCKNVEKSFRNSKLHADYIDCPGSIENEAIVNVHRIIAHLTDPKIESTPESCAFNSNQSFVKLNLEFKNGTIWPLKICYTDLAKEEEVCETYIPGKGGNSDLSEERVVGKILSKTKGASRNAICKYTASVDYKPRTLKYSNGCYIVYQEDLCTNLFCPKKIYLDGREINGIRYEGKPSFEYFPVGIGNSTTAISSILDDSIVKNSSKITSITKLMFFLNKSEKGIAHGIACIEDLLPTQYSKTSFNQCTPTAFIVDGYKSVKNYTLITTRLAIDNVFAPRSISWNRIFEGLKNYQSFNPRNLWAFYGVR